MLNEFVYCPRLFYFEQVEAVFAHNADTLAGKAVHRRVDKGAQGLPAPKRKRARKTKQPDTAEPGSTFTSADDDPPEDQTTANQPSEQIHARSVSLGSDRLGVTGKLDLVESADFDTREQGDLFAIRVEPVEYKKGRPAEGDDGPVIWPADQMQLGLQILLLRDNGYACDRGILYYRETRQRILLQMDQALETWILQKIDEARACAAGPIPPPLKDSPKCVRCSLNAICLPDETRALAESESDTAEGPSLRLPERQMHLGIPEIESGLPDRLSWGPFADLPEVRLLPLKPPEHVRRLVAPSPETKALYLNTPGTWVGKKAETLTVKEDKEVVAEIRLHDLHHLAVFGPVQVSTSVIQACCQKDIPITYFTMGGWFYGLTRGHGLKNVLTRIEQFSTASDPASVLQLSRLFVIGKIRNQRTLLMRNHLDPPANVLRALKYLARGAFHATSLGQLLGIEGAAAQAYFAHFSGMLKPRTESGVGECSDQSLTEHRVAGNESASLRTAFEFNNRNRRPPRDPVNALLSLIYSLLVKDLTLACYAVGFDPYVGFYHQPRFGKPALALDLMEEFRPIIADSVVITLINNGMIEPRDFIYAGNSVALKPDGRKKVFMAYEKRLSDSVTHPVFGYKVSYRRAFELQARLLAKVLTHEIEQYFPFITR